MIVFYNDLALALLRLIAIDVDFLVKTTPELFFPEGLKVVAESVEANASLLSTLQTQLFAEEGTDRQNQALNFAQRNAEANTEQILKYVKKYIKVLGQDDPQPRLNGRLQFIQSGLARTQWAHDYLKRVL